MANNSLDLGRYREPAQDELTEDQQAAQRELLEGRDRVPPPYRIWLNSPDMVRQIEGLGRYLLRQSSLTARENEIAILTIARHFNGAFVLSAHARAGQRAGLPGHVIEALREDRTPELNDAREQTVYDVAIALRSGPPAQPLYDRAIEQLGQRGIADLTGLLGYYTSVSLILNFHDVPPLT